MYLVGVDGVSCHVHAYAVGIHTGRCNCRKVKACFGAQRIELPSERLAIHVEFDDVALGDIYILGS